MKFSRQIYLDNRNKKLTSSNWNQVIDIISQDLYFEYEKLYQKYKDNKLKPNTTVYLTPLSSFPSYKLKNYIEENKLNIETARKTEKLDTLIINDALIKEAYFSEILKEKAKKYYTIPYDVIAKDFSSFINKDHEYNNILRIPSYHLSKKDKKEGNLRAESFIISEENLTEAILYNSSFSKLLNYPSITGELLMNRHGNAKSCDNLEFFYKIFDLIEKNNLDVVFDNNINSETNKDTVIDLETFQTLYSMLASTDKSNWNIAREIIANCDFEESKPYILFLANIFDCLKNKSDNKNYHMVHKALLKYNLNRYMNYTEFIQKIIEKYPQYKQIMCDCLTVHINHLCKTSLIKEILSL